MDSKQISPDMRAKLVEISREIGEFTVILKDGRSTHFHANGSIDVSVRSAPSGA